MLATTTAGAPEAVYMTSLPPLKIPDKPTRGTKRKREHHHSTMSSSPSPPHLSRSGGCFSCRRMKVKCDQHLPECLRCRRARRVCPGYPEEQDNFISMNKRTEEKSKLSQGQSKQNQEKTSSLSPKENVQSLPTVQEPNSMPTRHNSVVHSHTPFIHSNAGDKFLSVKTMAVDWETQIVHGFLDVFTHRQGALPVWLDFLPDLYNDEIQDSTFGDAIRAVSLMHFSQRTGMGMFAIQARRCYGRALVQASSQLNMLDQSTSDHLLAALSLLDLYEMMAGEKSLIRAWETHGAGQAMLLQLRGQTQFLTQRGALMYHAINDFIRVKDLAQKRQPTPIISSEPETLYDNPYSTTARTLLFRVTLLQSNGWKLIEEARNGARAQAELLLLLRDALSIDREVEAWKEQTPPDWRPVPKLYSTSSPATSPSPVARSIYPPRVQTFQEPTIGALWCSLQAARIRLLQTMVECTNALGAPGIQASTAFSRATLGSQIRESLDDICSTVPYFLGDVDANGNPCLPSASRPAAALLVLWPLHVCALVEDIDEMYSEWILTQLYRAGDVIGCRHAIELEDYKTSWQGNNMQSTTGYF